MRKPVEFFNDYLPHTVSLLVTVSGLVILIGGWLFDSALLRSVLPGLATIKPNTALCFFLLGMGQFLLIAAFSDEQRYHHTARRYLVALLAGVVIITALLNLGQSLSGADWGIDQWLIRDLSADPHAPPGRMALATAAGFILYAGSLLLLSFPYRNSWYAGQLTAAFAGIIGLEALIGYAYNPEVLYRLPPYASMSIPTAVLLTAGAAGLLLLPRLNRRTADIDDGHVIWPVYGSAVLLSLLITASAWYATYHQVITEAHIEFDNRIADVVKAISRRMQVYQQVLRGGLGLFLASQQVSREEWRIYIDNLQLGKNYPGFQGIGYAVVVHADDRDEHNRRIRAEGFADYKLWPEDERRNYTAIIYLEPFDERNRRAFGYDMMSEPVQRAAMIQARDTGFTTISGKVTLVQETGNDVQAGFLMYQPHYRSGVPLLTTSDRRNAIIGYVYATFRMNDLMDGILGRQLANIAIRIHDNQPDTQNSLLYESPANWRGDATASRFTSTLPLAMNAHQWRLQFTSRAGFESVINLEEPFFVLSGGIFISLIFGIFLYNLVNHRQQALALAGKMTRAYRREQNFTHTLLENLSEAVFACDAGGRLTVMNRRARARYGRGADNTHMDDWASIYHLCDPLTGEPLERENIPLVRALRGEQVLNAEIMMLTPDHQKHYVLINCGPLYDDHGNLLGAVAVSFDISERRRMEHELRQINVQLEATNNELESFSYSISHDLRSPLRAIEGFTQILQEDYAELFDEEGRRLLQIVRNNSRRMDELISDLLAFSRLGRAAMTLKKIDMNALVTDICDELGLTDGKQRVDLVLKTLPASCADYSLLRQVWLNLLTNAVKFSSAKMHPHIEAGASIYDTEIVYYVRDNGAGFDMRYYDKLFGVFQRLHSHDEFPGTGVGLAIVQRVISRHGGRVWAESQLDEGTVFYFSLPAGD